MSSGSSILLPDPFNAATYFSDDRLKCSGTWDTSCGKGLAKPV